MIEQMIVATPHHIVDRREFDQTELAKFEKVTGIKKTRRYSGTTTEMIINAFEEAAKSRPRDLSKVDSLIVVTQSPDRLSPCMAADIHSYLGLPDSVPAFDINHACDGWIMGFYVGRRVGRYTLLITADRLRYNKTPLEGLIFSDSVCITLLNSQGVQPFRFYTDGSQSKKLYCGLHGEMEMDGSAVFDFVTTKVPPMVEEFKKSDHFGYDWFVPHQANMAMNKILEMRTGFKGKTLYSLEEYGNQSMNSIPTAIAYNESKCLGKRLLACGFGAGYQASMMRLLWPARSVCRMVEI